MKGGYACQTLELQKQVSYGEFRKQLFKNGVEKAKSLHCQRKTKRDLLGT